MTFLVAWRRLSPLISVVATRRVYLAYSGPALKNRPKLIATLRVADSKKIGCGAAEASRTRANPFTIVTASWLGQPSDSSLLRAKSQLPAR